MTADVDNSTLVRVEHVWGTAIALRTTEPLDPAVGDEVFAWFRRVDDLFSTWRDDTEISRLGRGELHIDDASVEVRDVLSLCDEVKRESRGAFDVRVGADPRVSPRAGLGLIDPSGIVKGWALDAAGQLLGSHGVRDFALNAGGDVLVGGRPTGQEGWRVGIQHPFERSGVALVLDVSDRGVATSGRYEQGNHILNPRTGAPATETTAVTVVAERLALADAYATAAVVLGQEAPLWLAERGLAAAVISNDGVVTTTAEFENYRAAMSTYSRGASPI